MSDAVAPTYLVDASGDPVVIRIEGRASFQNSSSLQQFMAEMRRQQKQRFVIDFQACTSMDSTFLGVLAGAALELRKNAGGSGSLVLCRVGERNLELIKNLGLHRLLVVDESGRGTPVVGAARALPLPAKSNELDNARLVLAAHENLVAADESNRAKFQDVLSFLKARISQG
jgi:anti-sigma B factor antagonist